MLLLIIGIVVILIGVGGYALYTSNTSEEGVYTKATQDGAVTEEAPLPVVRNAGITVQDKIATTSTATSTEEVSTSTSPTP